MQNAVCKQQRPGLEFPPFVNVPQNFRGIRNFTTGFDFTAGHDCAFNSEITAENDTALHTDLTAESADAVERNRSIPVHDQAISRDY